MLQHSEPKPTDDVAGTVPAIAIRQQIGIPVKYVGIGEQIDDLQLFNPNQFIDALFDEGQGERRGVSPP